MSDLNKFIDSFVWENSSISCSKGCRCQRHSGISLMHKIWSVSHMQVFMMDVMSPPALWSLSSSLTSLCFWKAMKRRTPDVKTQILVWPENSLLYSDKKTGSVLKQENICNSNVLLQPRPIKIQNGPFCHAENQLFVAMLYGDKISVFAQKQSHNMHFWSCKTAAFPPATSG